MSRALDTMPAMHLQRHLIGQATKYAERVPALFLVPLLSLVVLAAHAQANLDEGLGKVAASAVEAAKANVPQRLIVEVTYDDIVARETAKGVERRLPFLDETIIKETHEEPKNSLPKTYFDDLDEASAAAAAALFPSVTVPRLFTHIKVEQSAGACWKFGVDVGLQMLHTRLPYLTGWH